MPFMATSIAIETFNLFPVINSKPLSIPENKGRRAPNEFKSLPCNNNCAFVKYALASDQGNTPQRIDYHT